MNELKMSAVSVSQPSELKIESFYATLNNHLVNSVFFCWFCGSSFINGHSESIIYRMFVISLFSHWFRGLFGISALILNVIMGTVDTEKEC